MFDFFRKVLGIPSYDSGRRSDDYSRNDLRNDFRDPIWGSDDYEDDDEDFRSRHGGIHGSFGFPIFTDPIEIHKYFEGVMDEMLRNFGMFGLNRPGVGWDGEGGPGGILPFNSIEEAPKNRESLRDAYLKPGFSQSNKREDDVNLDGKIDINDIKSFIESNEQPVKDVVPAQSFSKPTIYSSQVFVRTIRRPDGSVETIRKVRDHTGKEETTITHDYTDPNAPASPRLGLGDDEAGISIFRKYFPF